MFSTRIWVSRSSFQELERSWIEMKLKTKERYSLRMMMTIARLSSNEKPVGLREVSKHSGISRRYLEHLVPPLRNASLLRSIAGRGGGYVLSKPAQEIKLGEIIVAAIGPIAVTECVVDNGNCLQSDFCNCKALWSLINHRITQVLYDYSLHDLVEENWKDRVAEELGKSDN